MKTIHLSDSDIQRFTFDLSECDAKIIRHIDSCEVCQNKVAYYRSIAKSIQDMPVPSFEFELEEMILDNLPVTKEKLTTINYLTYFLIISCLALAVLALYSFWDTLHNLFSYTPAIVNYFIISVAILISIALSFDMCRSFNQKADLLNYS